MIVSIPRTFSLTNRIAIIGGGASGIFASIAAAEANNNSVVVYEAARETLRKVKISGGGRCNVLHDTDKALSSILDGYPRGRRELNGVYHGRFGPSQARAWFESHGVELKTEADGRMFPSTDSSLTIIETLLSAAARAGVDIVTSAKVAAIQPNNRGWVVEVQVGKDATRPECFDAVILATGSLPIGYQLAKSLGHALVEPLPSLFTLSTKHAIKGLLAELSGVSVPDARLSYRLPCETKKKKYLVQQGPLLITHHGLSGPAALRLSAFGAREFAAQHYRGELVVHWAPSLGTTDDIANALWQCTISNPKRKVSTVCPLLLADGSSAIPKRLWASLVQEAGMDIDLVWGQAPKKAVRRLAAGIAECPLEMTSKGTFKEEFVTAGGVDLRQVDMSDMQSKVCPGLFFCGEVLNVDGVTGGYNFMNCWSTGYVAGKGAADYVTG